MSRIAVLWRGGEPCIHSFALREDHRTALILSVLFAYVTNRKWVFHSGVLTFSNIIREAVAFSESYIVNRT